MLSLERIKILYDQYDVLIKLEVEEFGCKPTELRHLIGRFGEFYCALKVNGTMAHEANQHGFDVIDENMRRISVKTTAQKSGFYRINEKTLDKVDDLMLLQYIDGGLNEVYFGPFSKADSYIRKNNHWELDISKARKII